MRPLVRLFMCVCLLLVFQCAVTNARQQKSPPGYHVIKQFKLGGEGGWDYLVFDAKTGRLFITRSTHVMVVDAETGSVVGDIPGTEGVHGVALVEDAGKGYTSNGRASTVTVFDLKTLKVLKQIPVGKNPDAILYDPASRRVFTMNGGSDDATAIDVKADTVAGTVPLAGRPEYAVSDGRGRVFVNLEDKSAVVEFDPSKLTVLARRPLAPGEEPTGLAIDRRHARLFSACANKTLVVLDAETGKVVTTLPIGGGVDGATFDPETNLAFTSNGEGTLTVVREDSPDRFEVVESVKTQRGARTLALDPKAHRVYLVTAEFGPPPAATPERPHPRPSVVAGTFTLLVVGR